MSKLEEPIGTQLPESGNVHGDVPNRTSLHGGIVGLITAPFLFVRNIVFQDIWWNTFAMAVRSLWLHKMRSFLSVLGIIIGTSAMIALMSFGEGSMKDALDDIARQGATNIIVRSRKPQDKATGNRDFFVKYGLKDDDLSRFKTIPTVNTIVKMRIFPQEIRNRDKMVLGRVIGTTEEYKNVNHFTLAAGRFLRDAEDKEAVGDDGLRRNVAVIGSDVADRLFPLTNPIGQTVSINNNQNYFVVVGVISDRAPIGSSGGTTRVESFNKDVYISYESCMQYFGEKMYLRQSGSRSGEIVRYHQITLTVSSMDEVKDTAKIVSNMLKKHHKKQDWQVIIPLDRLEEAKRAKNRFTVLLAMIAGISLVVGGIGIMNIMLATVTERIREIGIRRALGAKRRDIAFQFIVEAVVQTGVGGFLGVMLGVFLVFGLPVLFALFDNNLPAVLHIPAIFISLVVSLIVGVGFGWYPAHRASRLDPIEALRHV